jgi:hypothetical protein
MFEPDAGGGSITNMFASGSLGSAVSGMASETQKLVDAAKNGGFKITPEGVEPLRTALQGMEQDLLVLSQSVGPLSQAPQLGGHAYGQTVAAHDQKGAAEETTSALHVLRELQQVVRQANEALARAAGLYKEGEQQAIDAVSKY